MDYRFTLSVLGRLTLGYGLCILIPGLVSFLVNEPAWRPLFLSALITIGVGWSLASFRHENYHLGIREGFAIVGGGWILASLLGALPYLFSGVLPNYIHALFETVSGLTTTGASVITEIEALPDGILLWRSLTHWLGGMGIIVLFFAFLPEIGAGAIHMFRAEVPGPIADRVVPRIRDTALTLWGIYTIFSVAQILLLLMAGMSLFDSANHTFATMATGGFSTKNSSILHFDSLAIELIIVFFMTIAGGNFGLYFLVWKKGWRRLLHDLEFKVYLSVMGLSALMIGLNLVFSSKLPLGQAMRDALFTSSSIMTTTGFVTADFDQWPSFSKIILLVLMLIGGSAGSTAGGMKVVRIILLAKQSWNELQRDLHPKMVLNVKIDGKPVNLSILQATGQFFFVFMLTFALATLLVSTSGMEAWDAVGAVAATLGNVGPAFGVLGPVNNYSHLPDYIKVVLTACMLLGRLELFTLLIFLRPEFWRMHRNW